MMTKTSPQERDMIIEIERTEDIPKALKQIKDYIYEHVPVLVEVGAVPEEDDYAD